MGMPRALKGLLQFVIGLALMFAFMYPRMAPIIRRSRAMKRAAAQPPRSTKPGDSPAAMDLDRILSFTSDVTLHANATLEVREEFVVHNVADAFRYGMVRDLPIDSEAPLGPAPRRPLRQGHRHSRQNFGSRRGWRAHLLRAGQ